MDLLCPCNGVWGNVEIGDRVRYGNRISNLGVERDFPLPDCFELVYHHIACAL